MPHPPLQFAGSTLAFAFLCSLTTFAQSDEDYLKHFPAGEREVATELATAHRRLMPAWLDLFEKQTELSRLQGIFGVEKRRLAQRLIPRLERDLDRARQIYQREYDAAYTAYEGEREKLRQQQLSMEGRMDWDRSETTAFQRAQEELVGIREKIRFYESRLGVLSTMASKVAPPRRDTNPLAGFYRIDGRTFDQFARQYEALVEAANTVKDHHADIAEIRERIKQEGETPQSTRALADLEQGLEKARQDLQATIDREKGQFSREIQRAERDVERLDRRIESFESRGRNPAKELDDKRALTTRLEEIQDIFKFFDALQKGAEPR